MIKEILFLLLFFTGFYLLSYKKVEIYNVNYLNLFFKWKVVVSLVDCLWIIVYKYMHFADYIHRNYSFIIFAYINFAIAIVNLVFNLIAYYQLYKFVKLYRYNKETIQEVEVDG